MTLSRPQLLRLARAGAQARVAELQAEIDAIRRSFPDLGRGRRRLPPAPVEDRTPGMDASPAQGGRRSDEEILGGEESPARNKERPGGARLRRLYEKSMAATRRSASPGDVRRLSVRESLNPLQEGSHALPVCRGAARRRGSCARRVRRRGGPVEEQDRNVHRHTDDRRQRHQDVQRVEIGEYR